ncbi:NAD(P)-binding domain protein [Metarhizium brunneum]
MSSSVLIALILGAGPNIGASVAREFASKGYKVVLTSRKVPENASPLFFHIKGDLSQPKSVVDIFTQVRKLHGEPSVVVYNAGAVSFAPKENTFNLDLGTFESDLNINTTSVFVAIKEALASFSALPTSTSRTFIYTGNAMNFASFDGLLTLGVGKSATAHMIASAAAAFADKGYKFYYADERRTSGKLCGKDISGTAHAELYGQLSEDRKQRPWLQTFVRGQGYVDFPADTVVTF